MMNIALGRYVPTNTIIHKIDPRTKILGLIALLVCIFLKIGFLGYVFMGIVILILLILSKINILSIFKSLKTMWFMILFLTFFNVFIIKDGGIWFSIWGLDVYKGAIIQSVMIMVRLVYMISITTILTSTTKPLDLTYALEWYFKPLKIIHFPAHEIAMTISIALRFIPTLLEETEKIMKAQASRGVDLQEGKLKEKISAVVSLIIPLFISAFQRSEELANAMEARGYNPTGKRTRYRLLSFHIRDLFTLVFCLAIIAGTYFLMLNPYLLGNFFIW